MTDNITVRLAQEIDRKTGYFELPVFSYDFSDTGVHMGSTDHTVDEPAITMDLTSSEDNPYSWNGASQIRLQYNFSAGRRFVLLERPEAPEDADFCLCIRYRIGTDVYRYKLWEDVGETIANVSLYDGETIEPNFVLEVWTTVQSNTVTNSEVIQLTSSLMALTEEADDTTYEVITGAAHDSMLNIPDEAVTVDTTNLLWWYSTEIRRITVNSLGQLTEVPVYLGTGVDLTINGPPAIVSADPDLSGKYFPLLNGTKTLTAGPTANALQWLVMVKVPEGMSSATIAECSNFKISTNGAHIVVLTANGVSSSFARPTSWFVVQALLTKTGANVTQIEFVVSDLSGIVIHTYIVDLVAAHLNPGTALTFVNGYVADFMAFSAETALGDYYTKLQQLYGYIGLPLTYDEAGAWLDND